MKTFNIESLKNIVRLDISVSGESATQVNEMPMYKNISTLLGANNPEKSYAEIAFAGNNAQVTDRFGKVVNIDLRAAFLHTFASHTSYDAVSKWLDLMSRGTVINHRFALGIVEDYSATVSTASPLIAALLEVNTARSLELSELAENAEILLKTAKSIASGKTKQFAGVTVDDNIKHAAQLHVAEVERLEQLAIEQERRAQTEKLLGELISQVKGKILALGINAPHSVFPSKELIVFRAGPFASASSKLSAIKTELETFQNGMTFELDSSENAEMADCVFIKINYSNLTVEPKANSLS